MGNVVGPMRGSGGGRDRMESSRSKDGAFDEERTEVGDKGEPPTQDAGPPASLLPRPYCHHPHF